MLKNLQQDSQRQELFEAIPKLTSLDVTIDSILLPQISSAESSIGGEDQHNVSKVDFENTIRILSKEINTLRGRVLNKHFDRMTKEEQQRTKQAGVDKNECGCGCAGLLKELDLVVKKVFTLESEKS